jgi:hypothetical protein
MDLSNKIRTRVLPALQAWRARCRFEFDLDQAAVWRKVHQPILAIYGELDRQVPVAENSARLTESVERSGNRDFTLVIYPGASHAIGQTRTGELREEWIGYIPEYLTDMTNWVRQHAARVEHPAKQTRRGQPSEADEAFPPGHYDRLRWLGNAIVQAILFLFFAVFFLGWAFSEVVGLIRRRSQTGASTDRWGSKWLALGTMALCLLNTALLIGLVLLAFGLANQSKPEYPAALNRLPLAGSFSACATLMLVSFLVARWRAMRASRFTRIGWALFGTCAIAFVPFLYYWNMLGLSLY